MANLVMPIGDPQDRFFYLTLMMDSYRVCTVCQDITRRIFEPFTRFEYSKTGVNRPLKNRQDKGLNDKWELNAGQKYCRMLPLEHSAIL